MSNDGKIKCELDGSLVHSIHHYFRDNSPVWSSEQWSKQFPGVALPSEDDTVTWTIDLYRKMFPNAELLSEVAKDALRRTRANKKAADAEQGMKRAPLTDLFGFPVDKVTGSNKTVMTTRVIDRASLTAEDQAYIPDIDSDYIFNIDLTKYALMGLELNKPALMWGFHGTGKTTLLEQVCARTGRPFMRVQHTINMEESHVLGQYTVVQEVYTDKESNEHVHSVTKFNLGPLPIAMLNGYVYCADEYDFALPAVTSLYQPVLEGKPLIIKDAPPELRVIRPHPNFRFVATGNTNGGGDETGLYQGTQIQNAAAYSRFGITAEVDYMDANTEAAVVAGKSGIRMQDAKKIIQFATEVRKSFKASQISATISPRELINAATLGVVTGNNWRQGLALAFANRLSRTDREVCDQFAQRLFG